MKESPPPHAIESVDQNAGFASDIATISVISEEKQFPLLLQATRTQVDLPGWTRANRISIDQHLDRFGAILLRGFQIYTIELVEAFAPALCTEIVLENGEHIPAAQSKKVQTPVLYAPANKLLWHNENTFNAVWPTRIIFACDTPASSGGETPLVDSRAIFRMLPSSLKEPFIEKGIMYVRNYNEFFGRSWQNTFKTTDREEAEQKGRAAGFTFEWSQTGNLRTTCVRPAAYRHPRTGECAWCNQAQHWHLSCLDEVTRTCLLESFAEHDLPRNCYYGDGSIIPDDVMQTILSLYQQLEVTFPWQRGDLLLVDNLLVAHGRNPYSGERKIYVVLGDTIRV